MSRDEISRIVEKDVKTLVQVIVLFQCKGLLWINAGLGVQGLYLGSSTGPAAHGGSKGIFLGLDFQPSVWPADNECP